MLLFEHRCWYARLERPPQGGRFLCTGLGDRCSAQRQTAASASSSDPLRKCRSPTKVGSSANHQSDWDDTYRSQRSRSRATLLRPGEGLGRNLAMYSLIDAFAVVPARLTDTNNGDNHEAERLVKAGAPPRRSFARPATEATEVAQNLARQRTSDNFDQVRATHRTREARGCRDTWPSAASPVRRTHRG